MKLGQVTYVGAEGIGGGVLFLGEIVAVCRDKSVICPSLPSLYNSRARISAKKFRYNGALHHRTGKKHKHTKQQHPPRYPAFDRSLLRQRLAGARKTVLRDAEHARQQEQAPEPQCRQRQQYALVSQRCRKAADGEGQTKALHHAQRRDQNRSGRAVQSAQERQQRTTQVCRRRGQYATRGCCTRPSASCA